MTSSKFDLTIKLTEEPSSMPDCEKQVRIAIEGSPPLALVVQLWPELHDGDHWSKISDHVFILLNRYKEQQGG